MATYLKQSTAHTLRIGPFLDETDGKTVEAGLTITQPDIRFSKAGGDFIPHNAVATLTHDEAGWYILILDTTDTDTVGSLIIAIHESGALPVWREFQVVEEAIYDALYASGGSLQDAIWDEPLTGAVHNDATSAGKRLRQAEAAAVMASGTLAAVAGHTVTLDAGAVATADYYIGARIQIVEGNGLGQSRIITGYTVGKMVTLDSEFITAPNTSSLYEVVAADVHVSLSDADLASGFLAAYTNTTTVTLDDGAVATANFYVGGCLVITQGTGAGQAREITGYTSGRVATLAPALVTALDTTSVWHIQAVVSIPQIVTEVWAQTMTEIASVPGVTATMLEAMEWAFAWSRNKVTQTSTVLTLRNDADDADIATAALSEDGTTLIRGELT